MGFDEETIKFNKIFNPGLIESSTDIKNQNRRFVHYTSANTAMQIIENSEIWFRNSTVMNDFSEIHYGLELTRRVFSGDEGKRFREAVEDIHPGTIDQVDKVLSSWERDLRLETYISCVSLHDASEDVMGRLSMWRAYGDVALVINNTPLVAITDLLAVYSIPVQYMTEEDLKIHLSDITNSVLIERRYLASLGQDTLVNYIYQMLFRFAIATKHPGFCEEKEWRLFYRPTQRLSPGMQKQTVVINGVPQIVYKLRLAHEPESGLFGADIPSLLDRVIIGPTGYPYVSYKAFVDLLNSKGVENADEKVMVSDIPLRTR